MKMYASLVVKNVEKSVLKIHKFHQTKILPKQNKNKKKFTKTSYVTLVMFFQISSVTVFVMTHVSC